MIVNPNAFPGTLETMPPTNGLSILSTEELERGDRIFAPACKVCVASETELDRLIPRLQGQRPSVIATLKEKYAFRQLLSAAYPDLEFRRLKLEHLPKEVLSADRRYVLKPLRGCFGTGVRIVTADTDLAGIVADVQREMSRVNPSLSEIVLTHQDFLIETFIEGEEYAIDMFYDSGGQPVITGIYHHPMPRNDAYLHMLYYSSRSVFEKLYEPAMRFFAFLNLLLGVSRFPIHGEFRLAHGQLVPIELNPLRFGGMGLGNLGYYAFGLNAYQCLIDEEQPDWARIWRDRSDSAYGFFIAYNGARTNLITHEPDWTSLRRLFSEILLEVPFDYRVQPAFGILYVAEKTARVFDLLDTEFDDYFVPVHSA